MSQKKKTRRNITTHEPDSPPPAGFDSWEAFRTEIWNAGLEQPGTRAFKIVGDELHEIPKEEAFIRSNRGGTMKRMLLGLHRR